MMSGLAAIFGVSPEPEALEELEDFDFAQLPALDDYIEVQDSETGQTAVISGVLQCDLCWALSAEPRLFAEQVFHS